MSKTFKAALAMAVLCFTLSTTALAGGSTNLAQETDSSAAPSGAPWVWTPPAGEKPGSANPFYGVNDWYHGTFTNYDDHDYFYYKNLSGSAQTFYIYFDVNYNGTNNNYLDYGIRSVGVTGFGSASSRLYKDTGRECWQIYLQPNQEMTVEVAPTYYSKVDPNAHYEIDMFRNPKF
ncbi:hypothetical protein [Paenibacillus elgii]|uniref:hypothetical protein n=1 Tax=Paenibacillus elgii TaxID=189691 RepID=UPI00203E55B5|nr:hypothetical protein [Paenibacillus elgii]MCM3271869.1 hypothetical protein [Paenibacillus elgii]